MSYPNFTPDIFAEHEDDGRDLDLEILNPGHNDEEVDDGDGPRMLAPEATYDDTLGCGAPGGMLGAAEILGEQDAIVKTLWRARDNRRPCPPMTAVGLDAPLGEGDVIGAAADTVTGSYPRFSALVEKYRAAGKPRIVRFDTEASYEAFRTAQSPERMALLQHVAAIEQKLAAHIADPDAHAEAQRDLSDAASMHEAVASLEQGSQIPLRMQRHLDGLMEGRHQDGMALSTMYLPRHDGGRWVVTATEPLQTGELEAAKAAVEAGVPAAAIVGYLPAIGASLAWADATKSLASGAEAALRRPEAKGTAPFLLRLEPKVSPAVFALGELCWLCCQTGDKGACEEWNQLAAAAPPPLRQAMAEILAATRPSAAGGKTTALGGARDFFASLWDKIRGLWSGGGGTSGPLAPALAAPPAAPALPAAAQKPALAQRASA